jgi:hypothetical protein
MSTAVKSKVKTDTARADLVVSQFHSGPPTAPEVPLSAILWQIKKDVLSKEVQTSPTYSYQWLADQAGHVAVGMLVVLMFWWILGRSSLGAAVGFSVAAFGILLVELYDIRQAFAKLDKLFDGTRDRMDLLLNASVAVWYVIAGAFIAVSATLGWPRWLFAPFLIAVLGPIPYWLRQKIQFQQVGLPFLFRLPEFKLSGFAREVAKKIDVFIRTSDHPPPKHIAIIGKLGSGKTSLAVGIATEGAFNGKKARYLTFDKLQQIACLPKEPPAPRNTRLWPWRQCQILVVDDVVAGVPNLTMEHAKQMREELRALGEAAIGLLGQRHTVWCLGADTETAGPWIDALKQGCEISDDDLLIVTLEQCGIEERVRVGVHDLSKDKWHLALEARSTNG